ncbi:hypothetical protein TTHERM_000089239 (macronuclear) [Tetrahymena thermophila SB210]|uniref:Uncharacterized protein n=1 Tax=Tetrahymena thermophila (strain SB210) TaxID=312017 RepID=W7XEP8_TETTS|nr:hypothetical protein TTHERM_000089239 [Tetrahymena thermophila SB210]EWS75208.1 hypothetical protein TTHERM_000089239 [Tetrahymena thermophila SB210]|eukprot:XP_012652199.1 hypothetical protein TTHERM_000089239 [Tetrahymena thermophila SB210]
MPQIAKYRLINTQSSQQQHEISPSKVKIIQKTKKKYEKICSYKVIQLQKCDKNMNDQNYQQYINKFVKKKDIKQVSTPHSHLELKQAFNNEDVKKEVIDFLQKSKNNFYKNILYAFSNHILYQTTETQRQNYEQLTQDSWSFNHIKLRVQQNLQNCSRFSLKVRNLLQNSNLSKVFIQFLKNSDSIWLDQSKIKNKDSYKKQIKMILDAYNQNVLIQNISFYKKQKKIINESYQKE